MRVLKLTLPVALLAFGSQVFAAVPAPVTAALDEMKTDALLVAGAVLVAIIVVMAVKFIRKGM